MKNEYSNTDKDIHKRIYKFILNCFRDIVRKIPDSVASRPIITQITKSLTSIGANDHEADASSSRRDFIAKYGIVKKEAHETQYWLSLIRDLELVSQNTIEPYIKECTEIFYIISSIVKTAEK